MATTKTKNEVVVQEEKKSFLANLPSWILILMVFFLPIITIPNILIEISALKAITFLLPLSLAVFIWVIIKLDKNSIKLPLNFLSLSLILVPFAYLISAIFSPNFNISFFGRAFELDTGISMIFFFVLLFFGIGVFNSKRKAIYCYLVFILSSTVVAIMSLVSLIYINFLTGVSFLRFLRFSPLNTIGSWFNLGIFFGASLILTLLIGVLLKSGGPLKVLAKISTLLSFIMIVLVGYKELWVIIGVFSLILFVYILTINKSQKVEETEKDSNIPVAILIILIFSILFVIMGPKLNLLIRDKLQISFSETTVLPGATIAIIKDTILERPILGYGPARFGNAWNLYRPTEVNLSNSWGTNFNFGYGFLLTMFVTTGIVGGLALILFLVTYLVYGFKSIFRPAHNNSSQFILTSSFLVSLYLWVMLATNIPSYTTLFITFLFTSVFLASLYREKIISYKEVTISSNPRYGFLYIFSLVVLILLMIVASYSFVEKFIASIYEQQAIVAINNGDITLAESKLVSAINLKLTDNRLKSLSKVQQILVGNILNNSDLTDIEKESAFEATLSKVINSSQLAIKYDPYNYSNFTALGEIFSELVLLQINPEGSLEEAKKQFNEAIKSYPSNPEIPLLIARAEFRADNMDEARQNIIRALDLKPNYTEAVFLLSQINIAEGDSDKAIENVRSATLINPNDPTLFFELGMMYYQDEQYTNAIGAFSRSVNLFPRYSNARYFLGLSLSEKNRINDAIIQFEWLEENNPNNEEIKFILSNLRNNLKPFSDVQEPLDATPENREDLPLEDDTTE